MICNACGTQNTDNSKFCIYCGVALISREEFPTFKPDNPRELKKGGIPSRIPRGILQVPNMSKDDIKKIEQEMEKWRQDPWYIPMLDLCSPTGIKQPPINPIDEKIRNISEETRLDLNNPKEYGVFTTARQIQKARTKQPLVSVMSTPDILYICGVCGTLDCELEHRPPIQQQHQEAFENIQRMRRNRYLRWRMNRPFPMYDIRSGVPGGTRLISRRDLEKESIDAFRGKSPITRYDVRKGIGK